MQKMQKLIVYFSNNVFLYKLSVKSIAPNLLSFFSVLFSLVLLISLTAMNVAISGFSDTFSFKERATTLKIAIKKRSYEPVYKTDTTNDADRLRPQLLLTQRWKSDNYMGAIEKSPILLLL